jgi:hypothetical protein
MKLIGKSSTRLCFSVGIVVVCLCLGIWLCFVDSSLDQEVQTVVNLKSVTRRTPELDFLPFKHQGINLLLMSAFYDLRPLQIKESRQLRLVSLLNLQSGNNITDDLMCEWIDKNEEKHLARFTYFENLNDSNFRLWKAAVLSCSVTQAPISVRIVSKDIRSLWIDVHTFPSRVELQLEEHGQIADEHQAYDSFFEDQMSICLSPIRSDKWNSQRFANLFIQWMEFYKLQGVSKVYVYDFQITPQFQKVVDL